MSYELFTSLLSDAVRRDDFELFVFLCDAFPKQNEEYLAMAEEAAKEAELLFTEAELDKHWENLDQRIYKIWSKDVIW